MFVGKALKFVALTGLCVGLLPACSHLGSNNSIDKYCDQVKEFSKVDTSTGDIPGLLTRMKKVQDAAPKDQQADWDVITDYMKRLNDAKSDPAKAAKIAGDTAKVKESSDRLSKFAKDKCGVEIQSGH
ncbi:hypothetical protein [Kribbella sp. NPDC004536]|uniref:hypothetical protein n=1 Tax=Kribbella sp. NPDC004536 TaxID=3364106 RepID=UPI003686A967